MHAAAVTGAAGITQPSSTSPVSQHETAAKGFLHVARWLRLERRQPGGGPRTLPVPPSGLLQEPAVHSSVWKRLRAVNEAALMGQVDRGWLRLGAAEALGVNGCLGLLERESRVPFTSSASRLHLRMLPGTAPSLMCGRAV